MIIVTGASRGIGHFLLEKYQGMGEDVLGISKSGGSIEKGNKCFSVDITDSKSILKWIDDVQSKLNHITLINCAGTNYNSLAHKSDLDKWAEVIGVNLIGTFNMIHALLPYMREQLFGRIINISSVVAKTALPGTSAYSASKTGLWGMSKAIAKENASKGITSNCINAGYFNLGMITEVPEDILASIKKSIPAGRLGVSDEFFSAIQFLRENGYINGADIDMNGALI